MTITLNRLFVPAPPNGERFTRATLNAMRKLIDYSAKQESVKMLAQEVASQGENQYDEIVALYHFMRTNIAYVHDPAVDEWLQSGDITLYNHSGDCDDMSILIAAVARLLGIPARLVAVGRDRYEHVYVEVFVAVPDQKCLECGTVGRWIGVDPVPTAQNSWFALNRRMSVPA